MKRKSVLAMAAVISIAAVAETRELPWYACIQIASSGDDYGTRIGAAFGKYLTDEFRLEGAVDYKYYSVTYFGSYDYSQLAFMVNAVYETPLSEQLNFFIGAGIGMADYEITYETFPGLQNHYSDWAGRVQAFAGVQFELTDRISLDAGYEFRTSRVNSDNLGGDSSLTLSLRYEL